MSSFIQVFSPGLSRKSRRVLTLTESAAPTYARDILVIVKPGLKIIGKKIKLRRYHINH